MFGDLKKKLHFLKKSQTNESVHEKHCLIEKFWLYICLLIMHENFGLHAYSEGCLLLGKLGYCMASSAGRARRGRQKVLLLLWLLVKDEVARYGPKVRGHSITTLTRGGRYSHLSNKRGGWNKCGGGAKNGKSLNVEGVININF